jgi:hypothetical protein
MILPIVTSCLIASSVHAVPLTWNFVGTTVSATDENGNPAPGFEGLAFELRIFVDTSIVGHGGGGLADVFFDGPFQGETEIETHGVLPEGFRNVQYFAPGGLVTGVQYVEGNTGFSGILFPSSISSDSLHLGPIPPTAPINVSSTIGFSGPNDLRVMGKVSTFSATLATTVPDAGSTALLLTSTLVTLGFLRRQAKRGR